MKDTPQELVPVGYEVRFLTGPLAGSSFALTKSIIAIGRDASNDIVITDDPAIASYHVRLLWQRGAWSIEKHPSAGSVTVNQQQAGDAPVSVPDGAAIVLGEVSRLLFAHDASPDDTLIGTTVRRGEDVSTDTSPLSDEETARPAASPTIPSLPKALLVGLAENPNQTQIAPLSVVGIPSLEVSSNSSSDKKTVALDKPVISVGRDAACDIMISERTVSGLHVQIARQGNQFVLIHPHPKRHSTLNGLLYQGRKIRGDEMFRKTLEHGDIFRIGDEDGSFVTLTYRDGRKEAQEELPPMHPIKLDSPEITIGRYADNTVVLPHPQVSGHHARLTREGGSYRIHDLNSTNHVYVNAQVVSSHLLKMGDEIHIGP
jgi:ABC transport system ATP-binding/permease protein